jgi:hypothetical protein
MVLILKCIFMAGKIKNWDKMKKSCMVISLFSILISLQLSAVANGSGNGTIVFVLSNFSGQVFFKTNGMQSQPSCATDGWAFDMNGSAASGGKAMLALLIAAQAAGKQVSVVGKGVCDVWGDRESVSYVVVPS